MNVEHGGASAEAVNGLFRVFHTVKGVAGFLELTEITTLAHTTETMLNRCREGTLKLADERLDVVFDATAMVRRMLAELRAAVQDSVQFATRENLEGLLQRLRVLTEDATSAVDRRSRPTRRQLRRRSPRAGHAPTLRFADCGRWPRRHRGSVLRAGFATVAREPQYAQAPRQRLLSPA